MWYEPPFTHTTLLWSPDYEHFIPIDNLLGGYTRDTRRGGYAEDMNSGFKVSVLLWEFLFAMADDGKPEVHKSCRALALNLVKCLDQSACMQVEKRSYKDCALDKHLTASPACRDVRDKYIKCKHEQVGLVVRERLFNNPELLRTV